MTNHSFQKGPKGKQEDKKKRKKKKHVLDTSEKLH